MNDDERQREIRELVDEFGMSEQEAAFAVALAAGETDGDVKCITLPLPEGQARHYIQILSEHHFFTLEEATRYVAGDRSMMGTISERAAEYWRRVDAGLESPFDWERRRSHMQSAMTTG